MIKMSQVLKWLGTLVLAAAITTLLFLMPGNIRWPLILAGLLFAAWSVQRRPSLRKYLLRPKKSWMKIILWLGVTLIVGSLFWFVLSVWALPHLAPEQRLDISLIPSVVIFIAGWGCLSLVIVEWMLRRSGFIERGDDN